MKEVKTNRKPSIVKGVGINDADYLLNMWDRSSGKEVLVWRCPYYATWMSMLDRCYSARAQKRNKTYVDCTVSDEWLTFSNFKRWMEKQDWQGKFLDKDILIPNNKIYSENTCVFVTRLTNNFIEEAKRNNKHPTGASRIKRRKDVVYECHCNQFGGKRKTLGNFKTPEEAHEAWLKEKLRLARILAEQQTDERVAKALIYRYENYKELFG